MQGNDLRKRELMRTFFGVDYGSRRIAIAMFTEPTDRLQSLKGRLWVERFDDEYSTQDALSIAHDTLWTRAHLYRPLVIALESPIVGASKNAQTAVKMSMMAGALAASVGKAQCELVLVPPATWKKSVVGYGNASKDDVAGFVRDNYPAFYEECEETSARSGKVKVDQDGIDAFCLAIHARGTVGDRG